MLYAIYNYLFIVGILGLNTQCNLVNIYRKLKYYTNVYTVIYSLFLFLVIYIVYSAINSDSDCFIEEFTTDCVYSNILDGGTNLRSTSILGPRYDAREEEYWCAFQAELTTHTSIGDLIKDHMTRKVLQGPLFSQNTPSSIAIDDAGAARLMEWKDIYIPKVLANPRDQRDIDIVLAFTRRPTFDVLISNIQKDMLNEFADNLISKGVLSKNHSIFMIKSNMNFLSRLVIFLYESVFFLFTYEDNLTLSINTEIYNASIESIHKLFHFSELQPQDLPYSWIGKRYLIPYSFIDEKVKFGFQDSIVKDYLTNMKGVDNYSLEYFNRIRGSYYYYDAQKGEICYSRYRIHADDPRPGRGMNESLSIRYYTPKVPYITWINKNLREVSLNYKNGDTSAYIQELHIHRRNISLEIIKKEKFIEEVVDKYCDSSGIYATNSDIFIFQG
jgi:hypothetical protein